MSTTLSINKFNLGLIDSRLSGSTLYRGGLKQCLNAIPSLTGPIKKRAGFRYLNSLPTNTTCVNTFPFIYNNNEAFLIVVTDEPDVPFPEKNMLRAHIYNTYGEETCSICFYCGADRQESVKSVWFHQIKDVVYVCAGAEVQTLTRRNIEGTQWSSQIVDFKDGPWLPENETNTKISVDKTFTPDTAAGTGAIITVSDGSQKFHHGQQLRLLTVDGTTSSWAWFTVVNETAPNANTYNVTFGGGKCKSGYASKIWREGAFIPTISYTGDPIRGRNPSTCCVHEGRLCFGMGEYTFLSKTDAYETFQTTSYSSEAGETSPKVLDNMAITAQLNMKQSSDILWMVSDRDLVIGTDNSEIAIKSDDYGAPLTPTKARAQQQSSEGSEHCTPVTADSGLLVLKKYAKKIMYYTPSQTTGFRYVASNLSLYNEEVTSMGITDIAFVRDPVPVLWCATKDYELVGLTMSIPNEVQAFHKHSTQGKILSVCSLPNPEANADNLYVVVQRDREDGGLSVHLEVLDQGVGVETTDGDDLYYSDSSVKYTSEESTTSWTVDSRFDGKEVCILADGAIQPSCVVGSGGALEIQYPAKDIIIGLPYSMRVQPTEITVQDIVVEGKKKNISKVIARFYKTVGTLLGSDNNYLVEEPWRSTSDHMDTPLPLFTGDKTLNLTGGWRDDGSIIFGSDKPLPWELLSITFDTSIK